MADEGARRFAVAALDAYRAAEPEAARAFDAAMADLAELYDEMFRCPHCGKRREG